MSCSYQPDSLILIIINKVDEVCWKSWSVTTSRMHANSNYPTSHGSHGLLA